MQLKSNPLSILEVNWELQRPPIAIIEPEEWSEERMQRILDQKEQRDGGQ